MKIDFPRFSPSGPYGPAALAIVMALIETMPSDEHGKLLNRAKILLAECGFAHCKDAMEFIDQVLAQLNS
jgi:hypothetical protein